MSQESGTSKKDSSPEPTPSAKKTEGASSGCLSCAILFVGVVAMVGLGLWFGRGYFVKEPQAWVYIDNGESRTLTVSLDGIEQLTVDAGTYEILKCQPGRKRITVVADGKTIFDESKDLEALGGGSPGKYLLNPLKANRYATWTAEYNSRFPAVTTHRSELNLYQAQFKDLVDQVKKMERPPAEIWLDCSAFDDVLCPPPPSVEKKNNAPQIRRVLSRIAKKDYEVFSNGPTEPKNLLDRVEWAKATADLKAAVERLRHSKN